MCQVLCKPLFYLEQDAKWKHAQGPTNNTTFFNKKRNKGKTQIAVAQCDSCMPT